LIFVVLYSRYYTIRLYKIRLRNSDIFIIFMVNIFIGYTNFKKYIMRDIQDEVRLSQEVECALS